MAEFIVTDPTLLAASLAIASLGRGLILFDGWPESGASRLAREMAGQLGGTAVDAADHRDAGDASFVAALRMDDLRRAVAGAPAPVLLSSLCARQVIEQLDLPVAAFVWVERAPARRAEQGRGDAADLDNADRHGRSSLHREVEAYLAAYEARTRGDVIVYREASD